MFKIGVHTTWAKKTWSTISIVKPLASDLCVVLAAGCDRQCFVYHRSMSGETLRRSDVIRVSLWYWRPSRHPGRLRSHWRSDVLWCCYTHRVDSGHCVRTDWTDWSYIALRGQCLSMLNVYLHDCLCAYPWVCVRANARLIYAFVCSVLNLLSYTLICRFDFHFFLSIFHIINLLTCFDDC